MGQVLKASSAPCIRQRGDVAEFSTNAAALT